MGDSISRKKAIEALASAKDQWNIADPYHKGIKAGIICAARIIYSLSSAEPEPLTDKEQRIFLAAMGREEEVCKQVDDECRGCMEPYEDSLVRICHEITRKVKGVLWT